ncbi:hypothetical protein DLM86_25290 [Paenibacillus flagellatus]|uniref:Uncharacterized protein n=1 Tax=Paenibacillus flagellatus TaxID=2211139 RepID=A0A2V5K1E6_9BACL|nr:hypothetical protein DLM86_25290 [Paenibacillus flagellatus]
MFMSSLVPFCTISQIGLAKASYHAASFLNAQILVQPAQNFASRTQKQKHPYGCFLNVKE